MKLNEKRDSSNPYLVDIYGSCVSRAILLNGDLEAQGCADPSFKINYFFDKHPVLSCVTPVPNTPILNAHTIETIRKDELWDKSDRNLRGIKQELLKSTLPMIRESKADFFIFDLYDFHTNLMVYDDTMFSPYKYEFFNTDLYKKNSAEFSKLFFPIEMPMGIWWGYVKNFFDVVFEKYGNERVVLIRFTACSHYLSKDKKVLKIPDRFFNPWMANYKYNSKIRELEDKIIKEYNPNVVDFSKYYICDQNLFEDLQGAHFSKACYMESFEKVKEIIFNSEENEKKDVSHYVSLSFNGIADILQKDMEQCEFEMLWSVTESPVKVLDGCHALKRISQLPDKDIVANRMFIGNLCRIADSISYVLQNELFSLEEKEWIFRQHFERILFVSLTEKELYLASKIFDFEKSGLEFDDDNEYFSFEAIFEKFFVLFENEDVAWVEYLKQAGRLEPYNKEVLEYLLNYANAIEDWELVTEYEMRLKEL